MPKDIPAGEAPIPRDPRVNVNDVPTELLAVHEFPGDKEACFHGGLVSAPGPRQVESHVEKRSLRAETVRSRALLQKETRAGFWFGVRVGLCTSFVFRWTVTSSCLTAPVATVVAHSAISHLSVPASSCARAMSANWKTLLQRVCHRWRSNKAIGLPLVGPPTNVVIVVSLVCGRSKRKVVPSDAVQSSIHSAVQTHERRCREGVQGQLG